VAMDRSKVPVSSSSYDMHVSSSSYHLRVAMDRSKVQGREPIGGEDIYAHLALDDQAPHANYVPALRCVVQLRKL
jgi:hypothetical protein